MNIDAYPSIIAIIGLYLIISANFLNQLLSNHMQELIRTNIYVKHLLGFTILYFLIILTDDIYLNKPIIESFTLSIIIYILFILLSRTNLYINIMIIIIIFIIYIIENLIKKKYKNEKIKNKLRNIEKILSIIAVILILIGNIIFYIEKKKQYKNKFNILKFFVGTIKL